MSYAVQLTMKSRNAKVGPMPVSTTAAKTCPDSCGLKAAGCYANAGPLGMMWRALSKAVPGETYALAKGVGQSLDWQGFTAAIASLPEGSLWRHNQAGDLPGIGNAIDVVALNDLVMANSGRNGFTYTHKPMTFDNMKAVRAANANGFTINLSADTLAKADTLANEDAGPVVAVLPVDLERAHTKQGVWLETETDYRARIANLATPEGRKVVVCPATYRDDIACIDCALCQKVNRKTVVGFPAHGASKRKASAVASS